MSCYHPAVAFPFGLTDSGKPKYRIAYAFDGVNDDFMPVGATGKGIVIPCGQCLGCRLDYSRHWAERCMLEKSYYPDDQCWFITLTYDDLHLPTNPSPQHEFIVDESTGEVLSWFPVPTLDKNEPSGFMKRLRRYSGVDGIRFFACGEYGSQTARPHYHLILFGLPLPDVEPWSKGANGFQYYRSDLIEKAWSLGGLPIGHVLVAKVTWDSCAYVARYVLKKAKGKAAQIYQDLNIEPEFVRMSRRPGIAARYFEEHKEDIYKYDRIVLKTDTGGRKFKPPAYYDRLYDLEYPEQLKAVKAQRKAIAKRLVDAKMADFSGSYIDLLANEERKKKSQAEKMKRSGVQ